MTGGGDTCDGETQAAIAGSVAEALWVGIPERIETEVWIQLDDELWAVVERFRSFRP